MPSHPSISTPCAAHRNRARGRSLALRFFSGSRGGWLRLACAMSVASWLGGCGNAPLMQTRYDLGVPPQATMPLQNRPDAAVIVPDVTAPADIDTDRIRFRFAYLNAQQTGAYAASRWAMTPPQMLTQRLRTKLAGTGPVLTNPGTYAAPTLRVELTRFEQVFTEPRQGEGVVNLRATLTRDGRLIAQRDFYAAAPAPTPDAAGGARALSSAGDAALDALVAWYAKAPRR